MASVRPLRVGGLHGREVMALVSTCMRDRGALGGPLGGRAWGGARRGSLASICMRRVWGPQARRCGASACLQDIVIHDGIHAFIRQVGQHFFHGPVAG
jgi:hypothetical protein